LEILPRVNEAVIPMKKLTEYALNTTKDKDKAIAFNLALGYNSDNAIKLLENIKSNLDSFPAKKKGDFGYGMIYEVILELIGENGKKAKVLTGWVDDKFNGEMRLTTLHID
jgi:rhodanese-related sulfurtransferase